MFNTIKEDNFALAYREILSRLLLNPEFICSPRSEKIKEILNVHIEIDNPYLNLFDNKARSIPREYLANELLLYFTATKDAKYFSKIANMWSKIKNDDNTINSAYGNLIFNESTASYSEDGITYNKISQWEWAKRSLIADKDTRQAIIHYNNHSHQISGIKDFPCTLSNQFFIRNDKLYLTTIMRSNDIIFGTTFDIVFFMLLMQIMKLELSNFYPDLELGSYTHFAGSFHIYENNFNLGYEMLNNEFSPSSLPKIKENPIKNKNLLDLLNTGKTLEVTDDFLNFIIKNHNWIK